MNVYTLPLGRLVKARRLLTQSQVRLLPRLLHVDMTLPFSPEDSAPPLRDAGRGRVTCRGPRDSGPRDASTGLGPGRTLLFLTTPGTQRPSP